jgi:UDP-N-acetylglucosamine 2-epimerase (non-hydrolysing)
MKIAAVTRAMDADGGFDRRIVHTGQHYDQNMFEVMFNDLGLPQPDLNLKVSGGSHAQQTGEIMKRFEPVVHEQQPDLVIVVGDVNSTVACALVATKLHIPVAHIESGLRSFDRRMPEEINRIVTDSISDLLFVSEPSGVVNLKNEGVDEEKIHFVGNVMIDTLLHHRERASRSEIHQRLGLNGETYAVMTLHRPSNVDDPVTFERLLQVIGAIQREQPVVFPVHPRTMSQIDGHGFSAEVNRMSNLRLIEPVGSLDFLKLMSEARIILTDSGGIQEEATILRVPCLTLRENTERPATLDSGFNQLVGTDPDRVLRGYRDAVDGPPIETPPPEKWDGQAGERIVQALRRWSSSRGTTGTDCAVQRPVLAGGR